MKNLNTWENVKNDLNRQCALNLIAINLSPLVIYLDLTITINTSGYITPKTYQKESNHFDYIPPSSTHPSGLVKSLIFDFTLNLLQTKIQR